MTFLLILSVLEVVLKGFVGATLWRWFVVPFGLSPISIAHMIGLFALIGAAGTPDVPETSEEKAKKIVMSFVGPGLCLLIGWIAHLCM